MSILSQQKQSVNTDFPNLRPSLDLRFALAKKLDPRITFTRGSSGTYFGPDGLMRTAGVNEPRFDHDPITGQSLGLFVEESRQNIALQSENINTSPWSTSTLTFATNSIVAPDGNTTADKLIENPSFSSFKTTAQSVGTISGTYTVSGFFKAGERFRGYLQLFGAGGNTTVPFNLRTGTISGGAGTNTITPYGNGWYRVSSTVTFTSATATIYVVVQNDSGTSGYTGDGTSGLYCWGVQVEAGSFPTSYIPTSGSTVTRSADVASMTGTNFSSWYNQSEGTIFADLRNYSSSLPGTFGISIGSANNNYFAFPYINASGTLANAVYWREPSLTKTIDFPNGGSGGKYGISYKNSQSFFGFLNGSSGTVDSPPYPNPTGYNELYIGRSHFQPTRYQNFYIARFTYYPIQLTNQQLINLTS